MAIAKNPKRHTNAASTVDKEREAEAFISGAGQGTQGMIGAPGASEGQGASGREEAATIPLDQNKKPIMVRVDPDILERIDKAAKRLGISRSAFIVSSAAERLERME
jgi:hypothetical protein